MTTDFAPRPEFVLYHGTVVTLHLGHRQSLDFDVFGNKPLEPTLLVPAVPFLAGAIVTQREPNTFSGIVDRGGEGKPSFVGVPNIPRLSQVRHYPQVDKPRGATPDPQS
jgi:hypothetical protein